MQAFPNVRVGEISKIIVTIGEMREGVYADDDYGELNANQHWGGGLETGIARYHRLPPPIIRFTYSFYFFYIVVTITCLLLVC